MNQKKKLPAGEKKGSASTPSSYNAIPGASLATIAIVLETLEKRGLVELAKTNPKEVLHGLSDMLNEALGKRPVASKDPLWTRKDIAAYGQCSLRHVDALIADKAITAIKIGRLSRFDPAAVKAAFAKTTRASRGRG